MPENLISLLKEEALFVGTLFVDPGIISGPQEGSLKFRWSLLLVSSFPVAQRRTHLSLEDKLVSSQCTAALDKDIFGQRCGSYDVFS